MYLFYFMQTIDLGKLSRATAVPSIRKSDVVDIPIPLPSLDDQASAIAEIEKHFSRLDEAVVYLKRVKASIERYKAAVLKAAVEGRLVPTEAVLARGEGRSYEDGQALLRRILDVPRNYLNGRAKDEDALRSDPAELPEPPEGWAFSRLNALASIKGGITVDKKRRDPTSRSVPYLRVANVQRGYLDLNELKTIDAPVSEIEELRLLPGDILFNEGGDRDKLGRGWVWEGQVPECIHQNHVFRARLHDPEMSCKFVSWWGNTYGRDYFVRKGKQTTNLASINLKQLSALPVPIPPPSEQLRIVSEVERCLTLADQLEQDVLRSEVKAAQVRATILHRMFEAER